VYFPLVRSNLLTFWTPPTLFFINFLETPVFCQPLHTPQPLSFSHLFQGHTKTPGFSYGFFFSGAPVPERSIFKIPGLAMGPRFPFSPVLPHQFSDVEFPPPLGARPLQFFFFCKFLFFSFFATQSLMGLFFFFPCFQQSKRQTRVRYRVVITHRVAQGLPFQKAAPRGGLSIFWPPMWRATPSLASRGIGSPPFFFSLDIPLPEPFKPTFLSPASLLVLFSPPLWLFWGFIP